MKQIIEEYWQFDGSISDCIRIFLKGNPNYKIGNIQLSYTTQHGVYAVVVYEHVSGYIK